MYKNVRLKRMLKSTIFPFFTGINKLIKKDDNIILLYSANHGIEHNLTPLKKYLLEHGYHKKYRIICGIENIEFSEEDGLKYITTVKAIKYFFRAKHVFYTTGQIPIKPSKDQIVIHMDHGTTAVKTGNLLSNINNGDDFFFTYYCAPSEAYIPIVKAEFNCNEDNIIINSEPVTDIFFQETDQYDMGNNYTKLGLWVPTFRQSDYLGYDDSAQEELLPTLQIADYEELNELLKKYQIKLVVKLHDMQDLSKYNNIQYSNLIILSGNDFTSLNYDLYKLLKQTDFILADYSSVFLQYLLLDKPIGFVIPDFEEYKEKRGFVFENVREYMPGVKITTKKELYNFLETIANNEDNYADARRQINNIVNQYQDGKSCERLIQYSKLNNICTKAI